MNPSDEKILAMINRAVKALGKEKDVTLLDPDMARRALRESVLEGIGSITDIHEKAKEKIRSLSRKVAPGTREWDELFARYVDEERRRRGL
jgi:hypothetical protein